MMIDSNKKRIVLIASVSFLLIILIIATISIISNNNRQIGIANYDEYIKSLPQDRRNAINKALYNIINSSPSGKNKKITDAIIRKDSYSEAYNESENTISGKFIVDIASIKQSYIIIVTWSKDENTKIKGDNLRFDCLPADQLIYGDFKCNDILHLPTINNDPIMQYLPYSTFNYTITASTETDSKVGLNVRIFLYSSDTRDGNGDQAIDRYKQSAVDWIKSKGLDINNYSINYIIN